MCFTSNLTFVVGSYRYLTFSAAAEVLEKLDKDEDWKVNFHPPSLPPSIFIHRTVYSYSAEFNIHRDKGISFIFF